ncbi:MAG: HAD family hydrolase [Fervidicoccus fontis]|uniref:HAD family hydrolase n=1 Tax=Fervidicoccus fontis TaxID=683846 RepID=A0A7C2ZRZ1_9CREN|nr:MAG: HAD family hydrolase [Fervidicoccus fontis]HEW64138.1 HAD family hydrolase [Fervidicoccus fontis]
MVIPLIKALTFDVWDTILNEDKFYQLLSINIGKKLGKSGEEVFKNIMSIDRDAIKIRLEGGFKNIIYDTAEYFSNRLGLKNQEDLFNSVIEIIESEEICSLAFEDSISSIHEIKKMGMKIGLVGNVLFWPGMITRLILKRNGLLDYFDATIFQDEVGYQKPSKEIFQIASKRLNVSLNELGHIGDSLENDFVGAISSGMYGFLIKRDLNANYIELGKKAYAIRSLSFLSEIIKKIDKA